MAKVVAGEECKLSNVADSIQPQAWTEAFRKKPVTHSSRPLRSKSSWKRVCWCDPLKALIRSRLSWPLLARTYIEWKAEALEERRQRLHRELDQKLQDPGGDTGRGHPMRTPTMWDMSGQAALARRPDAAQRLAPRN